VSNDDTGLALHGTGESSGFWRRFAAWCIDAPARILIGLAVVYLPMRLLVFGQAKKYGSTEPSYLWRVMSLPDKTIVFALWHRLLHGAVHSPKAGLARSHCRLR